MSDFESKQISHFQAVTSSDDQTAKHYLEASKGDLTVALDQFYMDNPPVQSAPPTGPAKGTAAASGSSSSHAAAGNMKTLDMLKNVGLVGLVCQFATLRVTTRMAVYQISMEYYRKSNASLQIYIDTCPFKLK